MSDAESLERIVQQVEPHSRVLHSRRLTGGISAQVTAVTYAAPGGEEQTLIVRQHGPADLARNPRVAADEFALLQHLHKAGMAVPQPLAYEISGAHGAYVAVAWVAGSATVDAAQLPAYLRALATQLHAIHTVTLTDELAGRLPAFALRLARTLAQPYHGDPLCRRIHQALSLQTPPNPAQRSLLHGDYWPSNVLWQTDRITAVLDWEDAAIGDPLADVANCRLELQWAHGPEAAHAFTRHYAAHNDDVNMAHLPIHDLCAALGPALHMGAWGLAPERERTMRAALGAFVDEAIAGLV